MVIKRIEREEGGRVFIQIFGVNEFIMFAGI